jgi:hypothetical protein
MAAMALFEVLPWPVAAGTEENYEKPVRRAGVRVQIRTRDLPNTKHD